MSVFFAICKQLFQEILLNTDDDIEDVSLLAIICDQCSGYGGESPVVCQIKRLV
jgi:hypothetical protein